MWRSHLYLDLNLVESGVGGRNILSPAGSEAARTLPPKLGGRRSVLYRQHRASIALAQNSVDTLGPLR